MKARFFALAALVLGLASCQKDFDAANPVGGGEVDFQLSVGAQELATRASEDKVDDGVSGLNSAYGAIDYLQAEDLGDAALRVDWNDVNLRYTLEVYDKAASYADDVKPVKDRQVKIVDEYEPVVFDLRLVPGREYHFVVFADFVPQTITDAIQNASIDAQRTLGKHHVIGNTLADIKVVNDGINDECTDAYFATKDIVIENSAAQDIVLKRPYGKLRVIATDLADLNINVDPTCVVVTYDETHPTEFNAITGETKAVTSTATVTFDSEYNDGVGKGSLANHFYTADFDAKKEPNAENVYRHTHMTLFTDYILAEKEGQTPYHFTMKVYEDDSKADDKLIKETKFSTDIPVERNKLTTVIGNVLTTATEIEVRIDDNFANGSTWNPEEDEYDIEVWDGKSLKTPKHNGTDTYDATEFYIDEASELAWLAAAVNGTLETRAVAADTFKGKTFMLTEDIDLNNELWTPIGCSSKHTETFRGTFDGQGHTIYNLRVDTEEGAGLFGMVSPKAIKNVTIENAVIKGNHFAGVLAGWTQSVDSQAQNRGVIENCHVKNATVTVAVKDQDNGDKAGALLGYAVRVDVNECSVNRAEVVAYRDVAALIGCAHEGCVVSGNSVNNVYVTADQSAEYVSVEAVNAGDIVGRTIKDPVVENNNTENVEAFYIGAAEHAVVEALEKNFDAVTIMMKSDAVVEIGAWTAPYYLGGIDTKAITIVGNNHILDFKHTNSDCNYIRCSNENAELTITDVKLTNSGYNNGPWNRHNIRFYNDVTLERVVSDKAIALLANGDLKEVTISDVHPNNSEAYGLWISPNPNGQTVNIENCQILAHESKTTDRGIKIDDQYVSAPGKVTLNIDGLKVKSQKKAAILVKSAAGADISISNIDITEVADDTVNAVWVDSDAAKYAGKVNVTGGTKIIEGSTVISENIASKDDVQNALKDAVAAKQKIVVIDAQGAELNLYYGLSKATVPAGSTVTITNAKVVGSCYGNGADGTVVFENCSFNNPNGAYSIHFDSGSGDVIFRNCQLYGWNAFGSSLNSVTFENCTLEGNGHYALIRSYADLTMSDCTVDTTNANHDDVYDEGVQVIEPATFTQNNVTYIVSNDVDLKNVLEQGGDVVLESDFTIDETETNGYGKTGINMNNGGTLDGNGNELGAPGSTGTWDSAISTSGGTIKNISVTKGFRGIFIKKNDKHNEKLYLDNVTIDGTTYTISCDSGNGLGLEATNSTFKGWTSYAATLGNAKFVNCYFGYGNGYSYCRPYAPTEFVGCEFEAGLRLDNRADVTFENCTLNGVALTQENIGELVSNLAKATVK